VVIAGGGTGGHLFPGIALAEEIVGEGGEVAFVGTERGIEARVVPEHGYPLELIDVAGIKGTGMGGLFGGLSRLPRAYFQSRALLKRLEPDVVVGVGGYASGPIVATASTMGIPTAILEQNSVPGVTNRILGRMVKRVFATFPDDRGFFPARKLVDSGNPIRRELVERLARAAGDRDEAHPPRLFVFGGSQGARAINEAVLEALPALLEALPELEIWHQTGKADHERIEAGYREAGLSPDRARVVPFIKDMAEPYGWCDLVLCRAGATSLSELAAVGCPALLVPFPHAADNHQEHNARSLVDRGAAVMVLESELAPRGLVGHLTELIGDPDRLRQMREAMLAAARPDAAAAILAELHTLARPRA
jgi:UDP-N-acetylglucosamine--N-acetylmuramyl-(pentapeptide) pyrophosphoryl-undecaprenol N-acetylglucosamine transferase